MWFFVCVCLDVMGLVFEVVESFVIYGVFVRMGEFICVVS